jgi:membrane protease YdiL (CAAX protease family)
VRRPAFWIVFAALAIAAAAVAIYYFPRAFSIVALDITMDRERALDTARTLMSRDGFGPSGYRQAASFTLDREAQTFVELEGGGKDAFTAMLRDGLYSAYTWRARQFREGETNETTIRFTPEGRAYGFVEKLKEDAPGAALDAASARRIAEAGASARWSVDFTKYALAEQGQERRVGGRVDHTLTYERPSPTVGEGRYRLRLVVSGDRLTEVTHFIRIPEAFSRRYANMRSANDAIGIGSVVAMALLYVFGGIGVGLFFMLRRRWVVWRPAAYWGAAVGLMQALAMLNELPLLWMAYDTALPRSTFLAQQITTVVASFLGFSTFFALSFMAAETLTRRAFGHHPQLWRTWSKRPAADSPASAPGASIEALGLAAGGYLLVSVFLAYDVLLYFVATKYFGWWSPSEALLHPDVLATYAPWLSAIANSFQAGFWEEALFRAVPLAGAALIGERLGQRRLCLVLGFIVQALVFGAGHAPYPAQPSYARPVELIIPSIGFGLLYVRFGLLPGIILHYAFDAVLFAIPILLADAPGIWFQKFMVAALVLVPLGVVLWRRTQVGRWTELSPLDRNAAWTPPPAVEPVATPDRLPHPAINPRARKAWLAVGAAALIVCVVAIVKTDVETFPVGRQQADEIARRALQQRGVTLDARWRVLPTPDDGAGGAHEFVSETAGEARRKELVGRYLPAPRWQVRVATFQGDVADRAEEWQVFVTSAGQIRRVEHRLPEGRAGASLEEAAARQLAIKALADQAGLDAARGQAKEVSARPSKLKARADWTFTFVDTTIAPLPQGEPRVTVDIAGDEITATRAFVYVPEEWERKQRAAATRNFIAGIFNTFVFAGVLVGSAVLAVMQWSRRRYAPWLFLAGSGLMLVVSIARSANNWPSVLARLTTEAPLQLQVLGVIGIGLVGLAISAVLVGLVLGAAPHRLSASGSLADRDALQLGVAVGLFGAAAVAIATALRVPVWAQAPEIDAAGTFVPLLQNAMDPITRVLMATAVMLPALLTVDTMTSGWRRRRIAAAIVLAVVGFAAGGAPPGITAGGWLLAGVVTAVALLVCYTTAVRFDLTIVPLALGVMTAVGALARGAQRAYPGALIGSAAGALLVVALGWWWFRALRRARVHAPAG